MPKGQPRLAGTNVNILPAGMLKNDESFPLSLNQAFQKKMVPPSSSSKPLGGGLAAASTSNY